VEGTRSHRALLGGRCSRLPVNRPELELHDVADWRGDASAKIGRREALIGAAVAFSPSGRGRAVEFVEQILSETRSDLIGRLAEEWDRRFRENAASDAALANVRAITKTMQERLLSEIGALARRSNVNLIGIGISALGLASLTWMVVQGVGEVTSATDLKQAAFRSAIRLSLAIFLQVFAYFFLRLYRYGIFEIKIFSE
jgi:hypothetical protein